MFSEVNGKTFDFLELLNQVLEGNITRDLTQASEEKRSMLFFSPLVGPALTATERKSNTKETDALIYSVTAVENYLSKILD